MFPFVFIRVHSWFTGLLQKRENPSNLSLPFFLRRPLGSILHDSIFRNYLTSIYVRKDMQMAQKRVGK
jgi:hypothetical protein